MEDTRGFSDRDREVAYALGWTPRGLANLAELLTVGHDEAARRLAAEMPTLPATEAEAGALCPVLTT